jgi:hypothetical protein
VQSDLTQQTLVSFEVTMLCAQHTKHRTAHNSTPRLMTDDDLTHGPGSLQLVRSQSSSSETGLSLLRRMSVPKYLALIVGHQSACPACQSARQIDCDHSLFLSASSL